MVTTIIILSVLVIILSYTSYNLLKKNEKCEDIIKSYENYMINLSNTIDFSNEKIKEVDRKGSFESDDEVGFFFQQLKYLQEQLNNFKVNIK
jgi:hypothetical protein